MMVLITYDVDTTTYDGQKRLHKVAKACVNYGQRVQESVFECVLEPYQYTELKDKLKSIMNIEKDSIRFYNLGSNWKRRVEHLGAKKPYDPEGVIIT